jgi:hypothetical protein
MASVRRPWRRTRCGVRLEPRIRVFRAMPTGIAKRGTFAFANLADRIRGFDVPLWIEARVENEQRRCRWWWR